MKHSQIKTEIENLLIRERWTEKRQWPSPTNKRPSYLFEKFWPFQSDQAKKVNPSFLASKFIEILKMCETIQCITFEDSEHKIIVTHKTGSFAITKDLIFSEILIPKIKDILKVN